LRSPNTAGHRARLTAAHGDVGATSEPPVKIGRIEGQENWQDGRGVGKTSEARLSEFPRARGSGSLHPDGRQNRLPHATHTRNFATQQAGQNPPAPLTQQRGTADFREETPAGNSQSDRSQKTCENQRPGGRQGLMHHVNHLGFPTEPNLLLLVARTSENDVPLMAFDAQRSSSGDA